MKNMSDQRAIELLEIEKACIIRQIPTPPTCGRNCADCDLAQDTDELLQAYDAAISALRHRGGGPAEPGTVSATADSLFNKLMGGAL